LLQSIELIGLLAEFFRLQFLLKQLFLPIEHKSIMENLKSKYLIYIGLLLLIAFVFYHVGKTVGSLLYHFLN
jgi:polyferredoxin